MLFSAAGVAFTPTLRPHVAQQTARAAVVCGLEAPVPPAAVVILEAATRQARTIAAHHGVGWLTLTPALTRGPSLNRNLTLTRTQAHTRGHCTTHTPYHPVCASAPSEAARLRTTALRSRPIRNPAIPGAISQPRAVAAGFLFLSPTLALMPTRTQPSPGRSAAAAAAAGGGGGGGPVPFAEHLPDEPALRTALRQGQGVHGLQVAQRRPEREGHRAGRQARLLRHVKV